MDRHYFCGLRRRKILVMGSGVDEGRELPYDELVYILAKLGPLFGIASPTMEQVPLGGGRQGWRIRGRILDESAEAEAPSLHEATRLFTESLVRVKAVTEQQREFTAKSTAKPPNWDALSGEVRQIQPWGSLYPTWIDPAACSRYTERFSSLGARIDYSTWHSWFSLEHRRSNVVIAYKTFPGETSTRQRLILTIWHGLRDGSDENGDPFIFQTLAYGFDERLTSADDPRRWRYTTQQAAVRGHEEVEEIATLHLRARGEDC
jgi:hypothetical protein